MNAINLDLFYLYITLGSHCQKTVGIYGRVRAPPSITGVVYKTLIHYKHRYFHMSSAAPVRAWPWTNLCGHKWVSTGERERVPVYVWLEVQYRAQIISWLFPCVWPSGDSELIRAREAEPLLSRSNQAGIWPDGYEKQGDSYFSWKIVEL